MTAKSNKARILIVDDHPVLRHGLATMINQQEDLHVFAQAESGAQALSILAKEPCDVVLLDITLGSRSGIEVLKDIKVQFPKLPVLMLSMHDEGVYAHRALRAGASGYITKADATDRVIAALRQVLKGDVYVNPRFAASLLNRLVGGPRSTPNLSPIEALSDRELEVFNLLGQGLSTRVIAERLHLSVKTVESHRAHIKEKLHLRDANELVHHAIQWAHSGELVPSTEPAH
jgi:DNA-binding NarL/FixJ family response regulator